MMRENTLAPTMIPINTPVFSPSFPSSPNYSHEHISNHQKQNYYVLVNVGMVMVIALLKLLLPILLYALKLMMVATSSCMNRAVAKLYVNGIIESVNDSSNVSGCKPLVEQYNELHKLEYNSKCVP